MNHLNQLINVSIDTMLNSDDWSFPGHWTKPDCVRFVDEAIEYLEQQELYEQCEQLQNVKKKIQI